MSSVELPDQVSLIVSEFMDHERSGQITLNFNSGRIESFKVIRHQRVEITHQTVPINKASRSIRRTDV